jgi:tetratricopeptide (TPR) repeat protein
MALRIGDVYLEIDEPQMALDSLKKGLDVEQKGQTGSQRKKGLFRSKENGQMRGPSKITARLYGRMASVYRELQMFKECQEHRRRSLDILNRLQNPNDIALEHLEEAYDFEDLKRYDQAIGSLGRGLELLRGVNNRPGIVAFNLNLSRIYLKKKDKERAKKSGEAALRTAGDILDWVGAKKACEILIELHEKDEEGRRKYSQKLKEIERKL